MNINLVYSEYIEYLVSIDNISLLKRLVNNISEREIHIWSEDDFKQYFIELLEKREEKVYSKLLQDIKEKRKLIIDNIKKNKTIVL